LLPLKPCAETQQAASLQNRISKLPYWNLKHHLDITNYDFKIFSVRAPTWGPLPEIETTCRVRPTCPPKITKRAAVSRGSIWFGFVFPLTLTSHSYCPTACPALRNRPSLLSAPAVFSSALPDGQTRSGACLLRLCIPLLSCPFSPRSRSPLS